MLSLPENGRWVHPLLCSQSVWEWTGDPARWEGETSQACHQPTHAGPSFPACNNSPHNTEPQLETCGLGTQAAEGGLPGHFEAGEGKRKSERQETTQGDHARSPPQPSATTSQTDRHRFSKSPARQMSQSIKKILMKLNHRGSC